MNAKNLLILYGVVGAVYFIQAQRQGMNPSISTAAQWPLWLVQAPQGFLTTITKLS